MNIIITGVNGFIGKNLYKNLYNRHSIKGLYNSGEAESEGFIKVNLSAGDAVDIILEKIGDYPIDAIVHLASKTVEAADVKDINVLTNNIEIAKNISIVGAKLSVKNFINLSSSSVYPNIDGTFNEEGVIDPASNTDCLYGLSKFNSEVLINYFLSKSAINIAHLRTAIVNGEGMKSSRITKVLEKEIIDNNTATLFGNGQRVLNMVSVENLVKYISFFIDHPYNGIVNVADECISLNELAKRLIDLYGNEHTKTIHVEKGNKSKFILDTGKLKWLLSSANTNV